MKQVLNIYFKGGTHKEIKCDWFTMTSCDVLVIAQDGEKKLIENIEWFGGWSDED